MRSAFWKWENCPNGEKARYASLEFASAGTSEYELHVPANGWGDNLIRIDLPFWVFERLKKVHLLERNRPSGKMRIRAHVFGLMALWDGPDFRPDRRYRASDPGYQRACSKDSGYSSAFLKALGKDCSGLVYPAVERTRTFESDLEHSRLSDECRRAQVGEALRAVRAKRQGKRA